MGGSNNAFDITDPGAPDSSTPDWLQAQYKNLQNLWKQAPNATSMFGNSGQLGSQYQMGNYAIDPLSIPTVKNNEINVNAGVGNASTIGASDLPKYLASLVSTKDVGTGDQYQNALSALQNLNRFATAQGPSQQATYLAQQQMLNEGGLRDTAQNQAGSQASTAMRALAMQGGLSSGARERLANQSALQRNLSLQNVARQGSMDRMGILAQDEASKLAMMQQLPGMFTAADQYSTGLQGSNLARQLEAQKLNQAAEMQAQTLSGSDVMKRLQLNQAAQQQMALQNAANRLAATTSNVQYGLEAQKASATNALQRLIANQQAATEAGKFNAAAAQAERNRLDQYALDRWKTKGSSLGDYMGAVAMGKK
jgi:hypothetical protein